MADYTPDEFGRGWVDCGFLVWGGFAGTFRDVVVSRVVFGGLMWLVWGLVAGGCFGVVDGVFLVFVL